MLTPFQKRKLTRRFHLYDTGRTGVLRWSDMERMLENVLELSGWSMDAPQRQKFLLQARTGWQLMTTAADENFDGEVSLEEWLGFYEELFSKADHEPGQLPPWLLAMSDLSFDAMDSDGDGTISFEEYRAIVKAWGVGDSDPTECFERIDTDGNGTISKEEWRQLNVDFYLGDDPKAASTWLWGDVFKNFFK